MICKPDIRGILALLLAFTAAGLTGCSDAAADVPPMVAAQAALEKGDGFGAELALRELLDAGTPRNQLAAAMGQAELLQDQPIEARKWLGSGEFSRETAGQGFHMLGLLEMREGKLPEAGAAFDRAVALTPDNPRLWVDIGRLRYRGGEQAMAVDAAIKAVELGPDDSEALMFRGQLARDAAGMTEGLRWLDKAIDADPDRLDLLAEYAATLGEAGESKRSLQTIRRMAAIDPGYDRAYFLQAVIAGRAGDYPLARRLLTRGVRQTNPIPAASLLSGVIDLETGNYASAATQFDQLYRRQPENRRVRDLLVRSLAMSGGHRELVHRFGAEAGMTSASPYLQTVVARSYEALGERKKAAELLDLASQRRSGNLVALRASPGLAMPVVGSEPTGEEAMAQVRGSIVRRGPADAVAAASGFLRRFPGSADALALAGDAQLAARNPALALKYYDRSARIRQSWPLARRRISALRMLGRAEDARTLLARFVAGHPTAIEPVVLLAREYYGIGNLPRAQILLDHAVRAGAERDPEVLALRSAIALRRNEPERARALAKQAVEIQPVSPAAVQSLALAGGRAMSTSLRAKTAKLERKVTLARR